MTNNIVERNFETVRQKLESLTKEGYGKDEAIRNLQGQVALLMLKINELEMQQRLQFAIIRGTGPSEIT
jgi:predicted nuclease with TOPRIM domain